MDNLKNTQHTDTAHGGTHKLTSVNSAQITQAGPPSAPPSPAHLHSRGSHRPLAHTCHSVALSLGAGTCTGQLWGHRLYARSHRQSSGRLCIEIRVWVQSRAMNCTPSFSQETYGCSWGSCRSRGYIPDKWRPCNQDGSGTNRPLHTVDPETPEGHRHKLWKHRQGLRVKPWSCRVGLTLLALILCSP